MGEKNAHKRKGEKADTILTILIGLLILYSSSAYNGVLKFQDAAYYLKKQFFATSLGLALMYYAAETDYHFWKNKTGWLYGASILLSTMVLFVGSEINGSKRWLKLGPLSFQPSELAKVALILFLARRIEAHASQMGKSKTVFLIFLTALPVIALVGSNNLSTAIILLGIAAALVFIASPKYAQFVILMLAGGGVAALFLCLESYRLERLMIWRNPEQYEKGYQTLQGLYAIGSGGLFGTGYGNSIQKLGFVPEAQNDMVFSIICEEFGVVGASVLILLFACLIYRFMIIANQARDLFGSLIASGILVHLSIQVILNIAVVTNTIPNTGITLPFISYGGTSVCFLLFEMGLGLNVSKQGKDT